MEKEEYIEKICEDFDDFCNSNKQPYLESLENIFKSFENVDSAIAEDIYLGYKSEYMIGAICFNLDNNFFCIDFHNFYDEDSGEKILYVSFYNNSILTSYSLQINDFEKFVKLSFLERSHKISDISITRANEQFVCFSLLFLLQHIKYKQTNSLSLNKIIKFLADYS